MGKVPGIDYKVYDITGLENVPKEVRKYFGRRRLNDLYEIDTSYSGHTALETIQYHRDVVKANDVYILELFVIVDRPNVLEEGVLVVNLDPEHGYIDAVRYPASIAADVVPSLSICNHEWVEDRVEVSPEYEKLRPTNWFAVYDLLPSSEQKSFRSALFFLDDGLTSLCYGPESSHRHENDEERRMERNYYSPVKLEGQENKNLDQIIASHAQYAKANNLDPIHFVVVDDVEWEEKGILFIRTTSEGVVDRFRRQGRTAGEMLNWIFIGLMTWEEAKNWDSSSRGKKRFDRASEEKFKKDDNYGEHISIYTEKNFENANLPIISTLLQGQVFLGKP